MLTQHLLIVTNNDTSYAATLVTSLFACFFAWKYLLRAGVRGQGSGVELRHDETADCQITSDSAARQSRQRSWAQSLSYQPVEAGRGRDLSSDVTSQPLGWRWQVTEAEEEEAKLFQLLPLVSLSRISYRSICVLSFHVVVGGGRKKKYQEKSPSFGPANH